jgi:hypothetical protein
VENQAIISSPFRSEVKFIFSVNQRPLDSFHGFIKANRLGYCKNYFQKVFITPIMRISDCSHT